MTFSGVNEGSVKWGYHSVATFTQWSCTCDSQGGTFTARLLAGDDFGLDQRPLVVVVPTASSSWRWPVRELTRDGLDLTMTVGPLE